MIVADAVPPFVHLMPSHGTVSLGLDLATSESETSNPAALVVMQRDAARFAQRLVLAWKTSDERVTTGILEYVIDALLGSGHWPRRLVIDASNETFFAQALRRKLASRLPVELVKGSENLTHAGETMVAKQLLGNLYTNAITDCLMMMPPDSWITEDHRLVSRVAGRFVNSLGKMGQHGDTFDAAKLAYWGQISGGDVRASAAGLGSGSNGGRALRRGSGWRKYQSKKSLSS